MRIQLNPRRWKSALGLLGIIIFVACLILVVSLMVYLLVRVIKKKLDTPPPPPDPTSLTVAGYDQDIIGGVAYVKTSTTASATGSSKEVATIGGTVHILGRYDTPQGSMVALAFDPPATGTSEGLTNWSHFMVTVLSSTSPLPDSDWIAVTNVEVNAADLPEFDVWYDVATILVGATNQSQFYRASFQQLP